MRHAVGEIEICLLRDDMVRVFDAIERLRRVAS